MARRRSRLVNHDDWLDADDLFADDYIDDDELGFDNDAEPGSFPMDDDDAVLVDTFTHTGTGESDAHPRVNPRSRARRDGSAPSASGRATRTHSARRHDSTGESARTSRGTTQAMPGSDSFRTNHRNDAGHSREPDYDRTETRLTIDGNGNHEGGDHHGSRRSPDAHGNARRRVVRRRPSRRARTSHDNDDALNLTLPMPSGFEPDDEPVGQHDDGTVDTTDWGTDASSASYHHNAGAPAHDDWANNTNAVDDNDYDPDMIEPFPMSDDEDDDPQQSDQGGESIWDIAESDMLDPDEYYPDDHDNHSAHMDTPVDNAHMDTDAHMDTPVDNVDMDTDEYMDTDEHMDTPVDNVDMDADVDNVHSGNSGSHGLLDRVRGRVSSLIAQARTEIGSDSDDDASTSGNRQASLSKPGMNDANDGEEPVVDDAEPDDEPDDDDHGDDSGEDGQRRGKNANRNGKRGKKFRKPAKPSGVKDILLFPFRFIMSAIRTMGKLARILSSLGGVLVILLIIWLVMNIGVARVPMLDSILMSDEGTANVESAHYEDGKATISLRNDSGMIAHISGTANVVTWNPMDNFPSGILKPHTTATCQLPEIEMEPDTQQTITAPCTGDIRGVWPRVQVKLEYT